MATLDQETQLYPFNKLVKAPENVRKQSSGTPHSLAATIRALGLLHNLTGYQREDGTIAIVAGGRRFDAIALNIAEGHFPAEWPTRVRVVPKEQAVAISTVENHEREEMHNADLFQAFFQLTKEGWSIDRIADDFGVTPLIVQRYLKLAGAAPSLVERFRNGEITTDQLIALCGTDDHAVQEAVWERLGQQHWNNRPSDLRRAVTSDEVDASTDPRIPFIGGLEKYLEAGGHVRADLWSTQNGGGYITDASLLDQLVGVRLEAQAQEATDQGWGWVEIWPSFDFSEFSKLGRLPAGSATLPDNIVQVIEQKEREQAEVAQILESLYEDNDDTETDEANKTADELEQKYSLLDAQIDELKAQHLSYPPELMAQSGVIIARERENLRVEYGMVKTADRKAITQTLGSVGGIQGGRESEPSGRKADTLSDALQRSLLGHRNLAVQEEVAANAHVAKVLMAVWIVDSLRDNHKSAPTDLHLESYSGTRNHHPITDEAGQKKAVEFKQKGKKLVVGLPKGEVALWDGLMILDDPQLDQIIAFGIAQSVSLLPMHKGLTAKLIETLDVDMSQHFKPTVANYLGRVSKPMIIAAMKEAGKLEEDDVTKLLAMKKGDLAGEAEKRLADSNWVPASIQPPKKARKATSTQKAKPQSKSAKSVKTKQEANAAEPVAMAA